LGVSTDAEIFGIRYIGVSITAACPFPAPSMPMNRIKPLLRPHRLLLTLIGTAALQALGADPNRSNDIYIQKVLDDATARNIQLISVGVHARAPNADYYTIVAHTSRKAVGHRSDEHEDRAAIVDRKTGGPNALEGNIYDITLPFEDASGRPIGALAVHVKPDPAKGDPGQESMRIARIYEKEISARIPSNEAMFERAP
jgi:hypothetical protein